MVTTMRKLLPMRLTQGSAYNYPKALAAEVRTARVSLEAVGVGDKDFSS